MFEERNADEGDEMRDVAISSVRPYFASATVHLTSQTSECQSIRDAA
jgi:hypothetical protein